jgi:hypothetical protein
VVKRLELAAMAEYDRPVGIGALVRVDTTRPVDVVGMAKEVRGTSAHDQLASRWCLDPREDLQRCT